MSSDSLQEHGQSHRLGAKRPNLMSTMGFTIPLALHPHLRVFIAIAITGLLCHCAKASDQDVLRSSKHDLDFHGLDVLGERVIDEHHDVHDYPGHKKDFNYDDSHESILYDYHNHEKDDYQHFAHETSSDSHDDDDDHSDESPGYYPSPSYQPPSYPQPSYPQPASYPQPSYQEPPSYNAPASYPEPASYPQPSYPQPSYHPPPHYKRPRKVKPKVILVKKIVPVSTTTFRG